jgi:hypothetical protein
MVFAFTFKQFKKQTAAVWHQAVPQLNLSNFWIRSSNLPVVCHAKQYLYLTFLRLLLKVTYSIRGDVGSSVADPDNFDLDPTFHFDTDPDPYCFKAVVYQKT